MSGLKLFILFIAIHYVCGDTLYLSGILRDQAPAAMWQCGGNPGTANGGNGWSGTDFQIGGYQSPEHGLVGTVCSSANGWYPPNCAAIGSDQTPVYAYGENPSPGHNILSADSFYNWFHDSEQTFDVPFNLPLTLIPGTNTYSYVNDSFFPLDGIGWTDHCYNAAKVFHNFAYCFEAHSRFGYQGNEVFNFYGDDDVWVFIDGRLVIDLGSIHTKLQASVTLASIAGLVPGNNYRLDFFYCERHTTESNLELQTTVQFYCAYTDWCGVCEGNGQSCCTSDIIAQYCNDNNLCTDDTCGTTTSPQNGGCLHTPIAACPPSNSQCMLSACDPAAGCTLTPVNCDDGNPCTTDSCDPSVGCQHAQKNCDDNNVCTDDSCSTSTGQCVNSDNSARCSDGNACTTDTCNPTSGCNNAAVNCDDGNACTKDSCSTSTGCAHATISCNDNNACTQDSCSTSTGCQNTVQPCNPPDRCTNANCDKVAGCQLTNVSCDDKNMCTDDSCSGTAGCLNTPKNCDDNDPCTDDSCDQTTGGCVHTTNSPNCLDCGATTCSYTDPCNPNLCNKATTTCQVVPHVCNDSNACTTDSCVASGGLATCNFAAVTCPVTDPCNPPICDKVKGCITTPYVCNDNNNCTTDTCAVQGGQATCVFTPVDCPTTDLCNPSSCNALTGTCQKIPVDCNDNNPCTIDTCTTNATSPVCVNTLKSCGSTCYPAVCNTTTGLCQDKPISCDDSNPCTNDTLLCVNSLPVCNHTLIADPCDDLDVCTNDYCNASGSVASHCYHDNITCTPNICQTPAGCDPKQGCLFNNVTCPGVGDFCKIARCDLIAGCISENKVCNVTDPGCFVGICNSTLAECITVKRSDYQTGISTVKPGVNCVLVYDKKVQAAVISAGTIAGATIGAVAGAAILGVAGKKGYDFLQARSGAMGNVANNPLYNAPAAGGTSALYGGG